MGTTLDSKACIGCMASALLAAARTAALTLLLACGAVGAAFAQDASGTTLLRGKNVTEENLLDALTPPEKEVVTRSLRE